MARVCAQLQGRAGALHSSALRTHAPTCFCLASATLVVFPHMEHRAYTARESAGWRGGKGLDAARSQVGDQVRLNLAQSGTCDAQPQLAVLAFDRHDRGV